MSFRKILAVASSAFLIFGVSALPAQAAGVKYQVAGKITGAKGKTVLLIANTGKVLGAQSITKSPATLAITSNSRTSNLSGASLQLVTTSGGDYYGPVVLGWSSSTKVYTQFGTSPTSKGKYTVGDLTVKGVTTLQGYAKAAKSLSATKKQVKSNVIKAVNYKPLGVGTYGKAPGGTNAQFFMSNLRNLNGTSLIGDFDIRNAIADDQKFDGGDADGDGLPNTFDVNDDGDGKLDQAEAQNQQIAPTPQLLQANCEAQASFNIFTNFKSTAQNFAGNLNYYGTGEFQATNAKIANALSNIMSIVIQPIRTVCGSNVVKSEFKGVGSLLYAPTSYVDITSVSTGPGTTGDYQWTVGNGKINNTAVAGLASFTFTSPKQISGQDVLMQRVTTADGKVYEFVGTMGFVFVTHPVPLRFSTDDGSTWSNVSFNGDSATYGTAGKIPLESTTKLIVEFAVPQRLAIDGEAGAYWDLGNMTYSPDAPNAFGGGSGPGKCDNQSATDTAPDSVVGASARVFRLGFTLGTCFQSRSKAWGTPGQDLQGGVDIQVVPFGGGGNSAQKLGISAM